MKRIFTTLLLLMLVGTSYGSHLMGGQITAANIGGTTYLITLTLYRDTIGIPMNTTSQQISYYDATQTLISTEVPSYQGYSTLVPGVEEYVFADTITFASSGQHKISWSDCCRNAAILNMASASGEMFYLENELWVDPSNSSPTFLNPPIPIAAINQPYTYNPLPMDVDSDSLVWTIDVPLNAAGIQVSGYTTPPTDASMPFTINASSGEISFMPNTLGNFAVSVLVSEYRNGNLIGSIRRDYQILVVPFLVPPPSSGNNSASLAVGNNSYHLVPGIGTYVEFMATDANNHPLSVSTVGEPLIIANPASVVEINANGFAQSFVNWTPSLAQQRLAPYNLVFRLTQHVGNFSMINDHTVQLYVGTFPTSLENELSHNMVKVFPNPISENLIINYQSTFNTDMHIQIRSLDGVLVFEEIQKLKSGENEININLHT
ncbi:MAG: hypothetical protein RL065_330, partial [Bacteroidota bacterium]